MTSAPEIERMINKKSWKNRIYSCTIFFGLLDTLITAHDWGKFFQLFLKDHTHSRISLVKLYFSSLIKLHFISLVKLYFSSLIKLHFTSLIKLYFSSLIKLHFTSLVKLYFSSLINLHFTSSETLSGWLVWFFQLYYSNIRDFHITLSAPNRQTL